MSTAGESKNSCLVSLAVVVKDPAEKKKRLFLSVQEHTGWYLPAGRVDFGEGFPTGAVRETSEEAGCAIALDGVLRIEFGFAGRHARMRCVFAGHPVDPAAPVKSVADDETICARWLTTKEMALLPLRAKEALRMFEWLEAGARVIPLSILRGGDAPTVLHEKQTAPVTFLVAIAARSGEKLLLAKSGDSWVLPTCDIGMFSSPHEAAASLCGNVFSSGAAVSGLVGVSYKPPNGRHDHGVVVFVFSAEGSSEGVASGFEWRPAADVTGANGIAEMATEFAEKRLVPFSPDVLVPEGSPYAL